MNTSPTSRHGHGDDSGSSSTIASASGTRERARRPQVLMITDRSPGGDSGYGMRVDNVITGLMKTGDLHVCLVDSSTGGSALPLEAGYATSVIRAENPSKLRKLALAVTGLAQLPYRRQKALRSEIAAAVGSQSWDFVWFSRVRTYAIAGDLVSGPRVVDFDDLNDRLACSLIADRTARRGRLLAAPRNLLGMIECHRWRRLQRRIASEVECVTVCSDADKAYLGYPNCEVVRNGYRVPEHVLRHPDLEHPTVLFVGPLSYEPNRLAAEWLAFEVLPRVRSKLPAARLVLVGYNDGASPRLRHAEGVTLTGYVHDLGPYYASAAVAAAPLQSGGGTRLKVMEALARSVPLVSTSMGCFGLDLTNDRELLIADGAEHFADACVAIIDHPALAARLTAAGLASFHERLTSDVSGSAVAALATRVAAVSV
ncbi:MAG: glycosyltransferase [Actinomycetota bacterium]|nr:glycosyltransferase [Actinomycetota bacterium]